MVPGQCPPMGTNEICGISSIGRAFAFQAKGCGFEPRMPLHNNHEGGITLGQRLNIEIVSDGALLANCYYHWSAYTDSALALTELIIDKFYDSDTSPGIKNAVELLESTGAGVNERERIEIKKFPNKFVGIDFKKATDRNCGIISVTENGMEETRYWEEARVTIDVLNQTVSFDVFYKYYEKEYVEEYADEDDVRLSDLPVCHLDLDSIPFEDIGELRLLVDGSTAARNLDDDTVMVWVGG